MSGSSIVQNAIDTPYAASMAIAQLMQNMFGSAAELVFVIFGGLVVWVGLILFRWLYNGAVFGRSGRRFKR